MRMLSSIACLAVINLASIALADGPYKPNWESLNSRPMPQWYTDAKIGIFNHWGVYSVPSWGPPSGGASGEWFWWMWKGAKNPAYAEFVDQTEAPSWTYADYASGFTAHLFNATYWDEVLAASGARYYVPTSKHHEGFCNWATNTSFNWNSVDVGPNQDLLRTLYSALRGPNSAFAKAGGKAGLYFSLFEWFNPLYLEDKASGFDSQLYVDQVEQPQLWELINDYGPEMIWADGDWEANSTYWKSADFLAKVFNSAPNKDTIVVNSRWGSDCSCTSGAGKHLCGSVQSCTDRYLPSQAPAFAFENALTLDKYSWGFRRNMKSTDVLTASELISTVIQTIALGGNALVNFGPSHDGTIPPIFEERLRQMGAWLSVVGEPAVYASKPWRVHNETQGMGVWYTSKAGDVFAHLTMWPGQNITLSAPKTNPNTTVSMLGDASPHPLKFTPLGTQGLTIQMPPQNTIATEFAWALQLKNVE